MKMNEGTRISFTGDMANTSGFGTITKNTSVTLQITMDDGRFMAAVPSFLFDAKYTGKAGTFTTEQAWENHIADMRRRDAT